MRVISAVQGLGMLFFASTTVLKSLLWTAIFLAGAVFWLHLFLKAHIKDFPSDVFTTDPNPRR